mgnify:CR=1 FL=1
MTITLKPLEEGFINENTLSWYSNLEAIKFSDNQYRDFSLENQKRWVRETNNNADIKLFGIFHNNKYIGNFQFTGLQSFHKKADISYFIGDTKFWGKGIMTFVIKEAVSLSITNLKLNKLTAGLAHENFGSKRALEKNRFILEGVKKKHLFYNGQWFDQLDYGLLL